MVATRRLPSGERSVLRKHAVEVALSIGALFVWAISWRSPLGESDRPLRGVARFGRGKPGRRHFGEKCAHFSVNRWVCRLGGSCARVALRFASAIWVRR